MRADKPGKTSFARQVDFLGYKQKDKPAYQFSMNNKYEDHIPRS